MPSKRLFTFLLALTFLFLFSGFVYGEDDLLKSFKKETTSPLSNTGKCQYINGWKGLPVEDMVASPDEKRQGVPSHFQATLDQLEQLYDGLQLHYGNERLGKKWKLK